MDKAYCKHLAALLLFGMNGIVASHIPLSSYQIVLARTLVGSLFLLLLFLILRQKSRAFQDKKSLVFLLVSGAAMGVSWMFLYEAYAQIGVSVATLLYYCGPVIVLALAPFILKEKLSPARAAGVFTALAGMLLLNWRALFSGGLSWGIACGILSALSYAVMVLFNKKAAGVQGIENALLPLLSACAVTALFTFSRQPLPIQLSAEGLAAVLFLGIVNTGLGCYLYFSSISALPAQAVSLCGYLEPLSALVFSSLFLSERLTPVQLAGAALILGGAALGEGLTRRKKKRS